MKPPILVIEIYEDIDRPYKIIDNTGKVINTIQQIDLYNAIRKAINLRLQKHHSKLQGD